MRNVNNNRAKAVIPTGASFILTMRNVNSASELSFVLLFEVLY